LSCVANDYGYEEVFARYLQAHGKAGDVLLGISTSGASANVVRACEQARELGMQTVVLTGRVGSKLAEMADVAIVTAAGAYADRVQELHIQVVHILIECVERRLFEPNYRS
jgi:D-sedoheptulose 7-phosphate isomerase